MHNTLKIYEELKELAKPEVAKKPAEIPSTVYEEIRNAVTKEDFKELKEVDAELAEPQNKSEIEVLKLELYKTISENNYAFKNKALNSKTTG